ncbi:MAG: ribosome biogenesis GTPase Der, partial [Gammaproteobacteria bacterium]|nr:ribosome biogenesis GTPase Der [Gammaproteobacteria bacterium]
AAIDEADVVLFLVDAREGANAADEFIAEYLRKQDKPVYLVANKVDGLDGDAAAADFYGLGLGEVFQIAAAHGRGVSQLLREVLDPLALEFPEMLEQARQADVQTELTEEDAEAEIERLQAQPIKLGIIGRPNVGKSTLTNRILGEDRVVVYDMPGTTRDSVFIPMERDGREYVLIDTAGVRRRGRIDMAVEKYSVVKTLQAIEQANVIILVIDAREVISDQDLNLLGFVLNAGRSVVIAVNKWDGMEQEAKDRVKSELDRRLGFVDFARIHFISALHGTNVGHLFESVQEAYASATQRVGTAHLTKIMEAAQEDHQPPLVRGRRVKLKFAHAGGYNPPLIVIHGNMVNELPVSYKRYLINYFRKSLKLMGTPIQVEFRTSKNPYEGRKNSLTLSQQRKRKRLMKFVKKK